MFNIAILGLGTVGGGVYEVLKTNEAEVSLALGGSGEKLVNIKYVLDRRTFEGHELESRVISDFQKIIDDTDVQVVIETMGGSHPAYEFSKAALESGKSVVTSNKMVVAEFGKELFECAKRNNVSYLYEASVGGGIPIISPLFNCLEANKIERIAGILNGTTNYILTQMNEYGVSFDSALADAQSKGFAEADPSADILGHDALRKICILAGIAFDRYIPTEAVHTVRGITDIEKEDISIAEKMGYAVKLLGIAKLCGNKACVLVAPHLVKANTPIGATNSVYNAISVTGNMVGEVLFYGSGAGSLPTASAVVSDVLEALKCPAPPICRKDCEDGFLIPVEETEVSLYLKTNAPEAEIKSIFDVAKIHSENGKTSFVTGNANYGELLKKKEALINKGFSVMTEHFVLV